MPSFKLTDAKCKSATAGKKWFDGQGLFLYVTPTGSRRWRLQYRLNGKQQTLTIGKYPATSLSQARTAAAAARATLDRGEDPAAARKPKAGAMTFSEASRDYWAGRKDVSAIYLQNATRGLAMHIEPTLGKRPIASITKDDLMQALAVMNAAELYSYVRKVRRWVSLVFQWAVANDKARINPALLIRPTEAFGRRKEVHHAALPLVQTRDFLHRLALEDKILSVYGCRLLMLTWTRTSELRGMRWEEIEGSMWRIPEWRMKRRLEHLVPLSRQAQAVIAELRERRISDFVFPNDRTLTRPMSENAILFLLGRIGYGGRLTGHGFRRMGSTWANENGFNADAVERQLAHVQENTTRAAYNAAEYLPVRREILQAWSDWLDLQKSPRLVASSGASLSSAG